MVEELTYSWLQELVRTRHGAECIYLERGIIVHAVLDEARPNGWGVLLKFRNLRTPGFIGDDLPEPENPFWEVSSSWESFSYSEESWSGGYGEWSVRFSPRFIGAFREAARGVAGADYESRYEALVICYRSDHANE